MLFLATLRAYHWWQTTALLGQLNMFNAKSVDTSYQNAIKVASGVSWLKDI